MSEPEQEEKDWALSTAITTLKDSEDSYVGLLTLRKRTYSSSGWIE